MLIWKSLSLHACTKYKEEETLHFTFPQVKMVSDSGLRNRSFFTRWGGGLVEFFEPPLRITMAPPPLSPHFFSCPLPPHRWSSFGGNPHFKRDIIIIKPDMHIFCSVQYDLYFRFSVKLLTTHSTDVASTSVNSKNKLCPFAKALLHYFSNIKKI